MSLLTDCQPMQEGDSRLGPLQLRGWRFCALDEVAYERTTCLFGGPFGLVVTGLTSWLANSRRRRQAERLLSPQWRPLGVLLVELLPDLIVVRRGHDVGAILLVSVTQIDLASDGYSVVLHFVNDAPFCLAGDGATKLAAALSPALSP